MRTSPASIALQAFARGLAPDAASRELGRQHALAGAPWNCPEDTDMLAYSLGYAGAEAERMCCSGDRAQPERAQ